MKIISKLCETDFSRARAFTHRFFKLYLYEGLDQGISKETSET